MIAALCIILAGAIIVCLVRIKPRGREGDIPMEHIGMEHIGMEHIGLEHLPDDRRRYDYDDETDDIPIISKSASKETRRDVRGKDGQ